MRNQKTNSHKILISSNLIGFAKILAKKVVQFHQNQVSIQIVYLWTYSAKICILFTVMCGVGLNKLELASSS